MHIKILGSLLREAPRQKPPPSAVFPLAPTWSSNRRCSEELFEPCEVKLRKRNLKCMKASFQMELNIEIYVCHTNYTPVPAFC